MKDTDKAIELYNRAYKMTSPLSYDRDGVLERLVPMLRELGRDEEATSLVESETKAEEARQERNRRDEKDTDYSNATDKQKPMPASSEKISKNSRELAGR
ncbi:MAG: hypothetical protein HY758_01755 [Nitrospirae bacterium]|nr:hypothetical protein [Nitrospirota bacterium]